ncbi:MAG: DUF1194 domain-containing protein [Verrucomicrobiota bacterium]
MKSTFVKYITLAAVAGMVTGQASAATTVGLELALLVDVSGSVDASEFVLQRDGYVAAFQSVAVQNAITTLASQNGGNGLAVSYIMWSGAGDQQLSVGWTLINDAAGANAFAASIAAAARPFSANTAIGNALIYGTNSLNGNIYDGRQVIDVSGDGENNEGNSAITGRNYAAANNVDKINGLPIGGGTLNAYYVNNVQYGAGSFTLPANTFADFNAAVQRKIIAEINNTNPVPEGGPGLVLSGILFAGLAGLRMKFLSRAKAA